jgi:hypothetical protein
VPSTISLCNFYNLLGLSRACKPGTRLVFFFSIALIGYFAIQDQPNSPKNCDSAKHTPSRAVCVRASRIVSNLISKLGDGRHRRSLHRKRRAVTDRSRRKGHRNALDMHPCITARHLFYDKGSGTRITHVSLFQLLIIAAVQNRIVVAKSGSNSGISWNFSDAEVVSFKLT